MKNKNKSQSISPKNTHSTLGKKPHNLNKGKTIEIKNVAIFSNENYKWMVLGGLFILIGILLMMGGKSKDPNVFNEAEIYSFRRITLAPILIVCGLAVEFYAILKKSKT